ncbi:MAG: hypothetical protein HRU01_17115, partial [Myxococcales bacterium]|nr:hypothetical protein [Myxococcales bacterium]
MSVTSSQIEGPRRLPVLTGVVCLALTASFVATHSASVIAQRERSEALEEASAYFIEQPHLVPSPDLEEYVGAARLDNHDQARRLQRDRRGAPPIPSGLTRRRQETLDGIMERARAPLETLAGRVHGLKPAQPSLETIFSHAAVHEVGLHFLVCLALLFWLGAMLERLWGGTRLFLFQGGAAAA